MNKKDFPIKVLQALEPYYNKKNDLFHIAEPTSNSLIKFNDSDSSSSFFFEITKYEISNNSVTFQIKYRPKSVIDLSTQITFVDIGSIDGQLNLWLSFLNKYENLRSPFERDSIIKQYQEEALSDFELLDDDADIKVYDFATQIQIDKYLDNYIRFLDASKTDENKNVVDEIKNDLINLKETQTTLTKRAFVDKLTKAWAKTRKLSLQLFIVIRDEAIKELTKQVIKGFIGGS